MINMIMSALAIIIIAGGIIALFAWLFWKAAHADPEKLAKLEEESYYSLPDTGARAKAEADVLKAIAYYTLFNK